MDRYGLASGKRIQETTIADRHFELEHAGFCAVLKLALTPGSVADRRRADRVLKVCVRRLVHAALDVERQRSYERGMEAFAAMPMVRERHDEGRSNRWTPGTFQGE